MAESTEDALLAGLMGGRLADPRGGRPLTLPVRRIAMLPDLDGREAELLLPLDLPRPWLVVSDAITREVLGRRIERALRSDGITLERPKADLATARDVVDRTSAAGALIAVGSGTLNDLVKHAAAAAGRPYAVFATAPSMNGYVTGTASLAVDGLKQTLAAQPPRAALFDLRVLGRAPVRLIRAGLGDSICRTTAEADWLLAHLLRGSAFDPRPFLLQQADEPPVLASGAALARGEVAAVTRLTRLLILSGLGMALVGSSAPASQGEHLISHLLDLWRPDGGTLHGEQVGVATLTMSRLQHRLMASPGAPRVVDGGGQDLALTGLDRTLRPAAEAALRAKAPTPAVRRRLERDWPTIRARLQEAMLRTDLLVRALHDAGAPMTPADLGVDPDLYGRAIRAARALRDRYTALDLAASTGALEPFIRDETAR